MRILHVLTDYLPGTGGLEKFVLDLARQTRRLGFEPSVLAMNRIAGRPEKLPRSDVYDGIPVDRVGFVDLKFYKPTWPGTRRLAGADLIHVHGLGGHLDFVVATKRWHRRPVVLSTHGGIFHTDRLAAVKSAYFGVVKKLVLPRVDQVVACGRADAELFACRGWTDLVTIDNGVDPRPWDGPAVDRVAGKLVFVGRVAANKHVADLIRTLAGVRKINPRATLTVVGPDRAGLVGGLRGLADSVGVGPAVTFAGDVPEVDRDRHYREAAVFVSASRHEGFGISAVEAMAAGTRVVLNDIPAFAALVDGAGDVGSLVDFANPVAAASAVVAAIDAGPAPAGPARAASFAWAGIAPRWVELYRRVGGNV